MSNDSPAKNDIRTKALVLRRTNYGEADRIINFLTEQGVIAAIAKGVRKEKSKRLPPTVHSLRRHPS